MKRHNKTPTWATHHHMIHWEYSSSLPPVGTNFSAWQTWPAPHLKDISFFTPNEIMKKKKKITLLYVEYL